MTSESDYCQCYSRGGNVCMCGTAARKPDEQRSERPETMGERYAREQGQRYTDLGDEQRAGGVTGEDISFADAALARMPFFGFPSDWLSRALANYRERVTAALRTQLAAAERERERLGALLDEWITTAIDSFPGESRVQSDGRAFRLREDVDSLRSERDAATARAETAEGLLRDALNAGWSMATLCFNWAQADERFSSDEIRMLKAMQERWDEVRDASRAHLQSLKGGSDAEG